MYKDWIKKNKINCTEIMDGIIDTEIGVMFWIPDLETGEPIFTETFGLKINSQQVDLAESAGAEYYLFHFGGNLYYTSSSDVTEIQLNLFKHIGQTTQKKIAFPFLGIHGKYDLMNGTRGYGDWVTKAKFFGITCLGICEKDTLAGTLPFQFACKSGGVKPILGATYTVERNNQQKYNVKLYATNQQGWENLLLLNKLVNVDNVEDRIIPEWDLVSGDYSDGLVCVLDPVFEFSIEKVVEILLELNFVKVYMNFDSSELMSDKRDLEKLNNLKTYLTSFRDKLPLIFIPDAYYLDKEDAEIKEHLNSIGSIKGQLASNDQYFKHITDIIYSLEPLFLEDDFRFEQIVKEGIVSCREVEKLVNFEIDTSKRHLPEYQMTAKEKEKYGTNKTMFLQLIEEGVVNRNILAKHSKEEVYERLETEISVIVGANVYNYFLITWDMIRFCKEKDILTGFGRGSAAGCLISYLLGLLHVNPLEHGLLFERFLNPGRVMKSLPDIDSDIETSRREEVKAYLEFRYGDTRVASIGTYTSLKLRAALKDLNREMGTTDTGTMNYMCKSLGQTGIGRGDSNVSFLEFFQRAALKPKLKEWMQENTEMINLVPLCYASPKAASIHACAMVITPKISEEDDIFRRIPIRKMGDVLVTEWQGEDLDGLGYLKQDVLGLRQLDKFRDILDLIKENEGIDIDIYNLPLDDKNIYKMFSEGFGRDVFHFGSDTLANYLRAMQPDSIHDLIAAISLVRPGAMGIGAHAKYLSVKSGESEPDYDFGLEEVTKHTYGVTIYQEQVMESVRVLADFTLAEADDVRRGLGKMNVKYLAPYKERFIDKTVGKGCGKEEALAIWDKLAGFARYGFNKSHAAAYSITGYVCNWLKFYFPTQFWVVALEYADDSKIPSYVSEINKMKGIKISPPDINKSYVGFVADYKTNTIFWSIDSIKFVGAASVEKILEARNRVGSFVNLEHLLEEVDQKHLNKRVVTNMIIAGCFDIMCNIKHSYQRVHILEEFYRLRKIKKKDQVAWMDSKSINYEWFWTLKQNEICGLGLMSYKDALQYTDNLYEEEQYFVDEEEFYLDEYHNKYVVVGGIVTEVMERQSKRGGMGKIVINCNTEPIEVRLWPDQWNKKDENGISMREELLKSKGKILFISGKIAPPSIYNADNLLQTVGGSRSKHSTSYALL